VVIARRANTLDDRRHAGGKLIGVDRDSLASLCSSLGRISGVTEPCALRLLPGERLAGPLGDQLTLLLSETCVEVEDERIDNRAESGNHKRNMVPP